MYETKVTQWTLAQFFARIYSVVAMGVGVSAIVAYMTIAFFPENMTKVSSLLLMALWLVELGLVVSLSRSAAKNSSFALPGFILFSAVNGFLLSFTLSFYPGTLVAQAFIATAAMFVIMALIGVRTSKDLSALGQACRAALIGVIIAGLVFMFFPANGVVGLALSVVTVLIFSGLIAWDNQQIKNVYAQNNGDVTEGWAISLGLSLYLDFINLFLAILRIFGSFKD